MPLATIIQLSATQLCRKMPPGTHCKLHTTASQLCLRSSTIADGSQDRRASPQSAAIWLHAARAEQSHPWLRMHSTVAGMRLQMQLVWPHPIVSMLDRSSGRESLFQTATIWKWLESCRLIFGLVLHLRFPHFCKVAKRHRVPRDLSSCWSFELESVGCRAWRRKKAYMHTR